MTHDIFNEIVKHAKNHNSYYLSIIRLRNHLNYLITINVINITILTK